MESLRNQIIRHFEMKQRQVRVRIPFDELKLIGETRRMATVISENYDEHGTILEFQLKPIDLARLKSHFPNISFAEK